MPDKAIVIGVSHYPTLGRDGAESNDLPGALYDAESMADWLANSAHAEVTKITSTGLNDQPWDVTMVRPQIGDVHNAFRPYIVAPNRVGNRLYVYMAGHGIAPEPRSRCLILADAVNSTQPWVPNCEAPAWIDWLANQTQFDEFVLWMDCCGTQGLEYVRGLPPVAQRITRAQPDAKVFMAFASSDGRSTYEGSSGDDGIPRGFFTDRLLQGLKGAASNAAGEIRSGSLASYLRNGATQILDDQAARSAPRPPPEVPHEHDMLFPKGALTSYQIQIRDDAGGVPSNGTVITVSRPTEPFTQNAPVQDGWVSFPLPMGLFKLAGPQIQKYIEIGASTPTRIVAP